MRASWGIAGRLTQLKLKSGGQLECLYLLIRADGLMHFVAEVHLWVSPGTETGGRPSAVPLSRTGSEGQSTQNFLRVLPIIAPHHETEAHPVASADAGAGWGVQGLTGVRPFGFLKRQRLCFNNRTRRCIIGRGSVHYEPLTIRGGCGTRRRDRPTNRRFPSRHVIAPGPIARIHRRTPAESAQQPPVVLSKVDQRSPPTVVCEVTLTRFSDPDDTDTMTTPRLQLFLPSLLLAAGIVGGGHFIGKGIADRNDGRRTVSVKGLSEREVAASIAIWNVGFRAPETNSQN